MTPDLTVIDEIAGDPLEPHVAALLATPSDAEAALAAAPRVRTRRTLSGKRIHEVVTPEHDDAVGNLTGALRQVVSKAQIRADREADEAAAAAEPGAPQQVTVPEGAGDRRQRRAWERQQATAARKARAARTREYAARERLIPATAKGATQ